LYNAFSSQTVYYTIIDVAIRKKLEYGVYFVFIYFLPMLVFNTFPANVVKKTVCVCLFVFFGNTYIMPRSLYTQKLLFNNKHIASWRTYGQSFHKITWRKELTFGQKNFQTLLSVESLRLLKFIPCVGHHQLTWVLFQFPISTITYFILLRVLVYQYIVHFPISWILDTNKRKRNSTWKTKRNKKGGI